MPTRENQKVMQVPQHYQKKRPTKSKTPKSKTPKQSTPTELLVPEAHHTKHSEWFKEITGCDEKPFCATRERSIIEMKAPVADVKKFGLLLGIKNQQTASLRVCGQFKLHMYGDLLLSLGFGKAEHRKQAANHYPLFEIVTRVDEESLKFVDVAYLQACKEK